RSRLAIQATGSAMAADVYVAAVVNSRGGFGSTKWTSPRPASRSAKKAARMPNTLVGRRPPLAGHSTTIDHGSTVPRGCPVQYLSANAANDIKSNHHALRDFDRLRQSSISTDEPPDV